MPATEEPPVAEPGTTSVGGFLNKFLKENPQIEKGLSEPITSETVKESIAPKETVAKAPEPEPAKAPAKEPEKPEAKAPERSKVFGTKIKPEAKAPVEIPAEELKGMSAKAQDKWTELRTSEASARRELDQLRRDYDELGKKSNTDATLPAQLETMKAELAAEKAAREEIEQELSVAAVDRSKEYQAKVAAPRQTIEQQIEVIAKRVDVPAKKIIAALSEPLDSRADALDEILPPEMKDFDRQTIALLSSKMDEVNRTADELREKAKTSREHMLADRQTESETARAQTRAEAMKVAQRVFNEAAKTHSFLAGKTGDDAWDKWVESERDSTLGIDLGDPAKLGEVLARAAETQPLEKALEHYRGLYEASSKNEAALEARLARYEKSSAGLKGGGGDEPAPVEDDNVTPGQKIMRGVLAGRR